LFGHVSNIHLFSSTIVLVDHADTVARHTTVAAFEFMPAIVLLSENLVNEFYAPVVAASAKSICKSQRRLQFIFSIAA